ncbi:RNA-directed DNA polymerase, eukaryota [Tanacetum coccineum]|uniref:RNA-directed DNA polymerase, eukaryota n=1 Tax=Tanacetum coccineum TaxID=301880 RepID=A0ABQ4WZ87_9ASTR
MDVKLMWGNSNYDFVFSDSLGNSGGILCIWEASVFEKDNVTISDNFIAIYGTWLPCNVKVLFVAIYAPQQPVQKRVLWDYVSMILEQWNGESILMGDFNEVRSSDERRGSWFNSASAQAFNHFISVSGLVDVKLEGFSFTWSHPSATKMSKIDRFLVSDGIISLFPSITALCLDRHLSDHRPILLHDIKLDFGPTPFRFYHAWFKYEGFDEMVNQTWRSFSHSDRNGMVRFKKKLFDLKIVIRQWVKSKRAQLCNTKQALEGELHEVDEDLDHGTVNEDLLVRRKDIIRQLHDIKTKGDAELIQKSKIRWAIEGDENTKFFHGIINKKRSHLAIRGVLIDGVWQIDPKVVKEAFQKHFEDRFNKVTSSGPKLNFTFPKRLFHDQVEDLDRDVTRDEIREAVWSCGENKSPGPDGYTFEFFKKYWNLVGTDLCEAVEFFFINGVFANGCNASFITLIPKVADAKLVSDFRPISLIGSIYKVVTKIMANRLAMVISDIVSDTQSAFVSDRQILDGPFIINEILQWCKRKNKQALFFKVDFAKAYDSVRWDYLIDVLEAFGFGPKWCQWVRGTFSHAKASVLVNGSPSNEFAFHCGLKQGDPLAPFLFILVMESLHLSFNRVVEAERFKGIRIGRSFSLSHLFYADDALIVGEWSQDNLRCIIHVLQVFYLASGLQINIHKSQILGVGVPKVDVEAAAVSIGCSVTPPKFRTTQRNGNIGIGDGLETNFWTDIWKGDIALCDMFPRVYALETNKLISVAGKLASPNDRSFRRMVRGGIEEQQL